MSRWRVQDEAKTSKHHVQLRLKLGTYQLPLISLQLNAKTLVTILEAKLLFIQSHQVIIEGCFENSNEGQMVSYIFNKVSNHLWLQSF